MAVTYAVSDLKREVTGSRRMHLGKLTADGSATYSTAGDAVSASLLGLSVIEGLIVTVLRNSATTGEFVARSNRVSDSSWKIQVFGAVDATPAANEVSPELAAATSVANFELDFVAYGR